jgi:DNA-binding transcriptional ArsR family regulator
LSGRGWSRERVGLLLAAVGNSEAKALLLLAMEPGLAYTGGELRGLLAGLQPGARVARPGSWNQFQCCQQSFEPAGLVRGWVDEDATRFELTPEAGRDGQAVAGLALGLSERHPDIGLRRVFGGTQSMATDGLRGPVRRIAIMEQLLALAADTGAVTITDLYRRLSGIDPKLVDRHLDGMRRDGLLNLASLSVPDQWVEYRLTGYIPARLPAPPWNRDLLGPTRSALTRLAGNQTWISLPAPASTRPTRRQASRVSEPVRAICDHLVEHGILTKRGVRYSAITTSPNQTRLMRDVLHLVTAAQTGQADVLTAGRRLGQTIIADPDPDRVRTLLDTARRTSRNANATPLTVKIQFVTAYLTRNPGATTTEITTALTDHDLSQATVRNTLSAMRRADTVTQSSRGPKSTWTLTHPPTPTTPDNNR